MEASLTLRDVEASDLPFFFEHQLDPEANWMVAFTRKDPTDQEAFMSHWQRVLQNPEGTRQTILFAHQVVGYVLAYRDEGRLEVGYWIGKAYWGQGIATRALELLLKQITERPIYARVVTDNHGSLRVLQKAGFQILHSNTDYAPARQQEVEEYILCLNQ
jgi:RimJ/RimL family protein N-acetyltransferase